MSILKYFDYPTSEEWVELFKNKKQKFNKTELKIKEIKSVSNMRELSYTEELESWIQSYNNRVFDLHVNYVMLKYFYNKGIPDQEWYVSGNKQSVEYHTQFEEKHTSYHYWFCSYVKGFYTEFTDLIDTLYHLINIKFRYNVKPGLGLRRKVLRKLENDDRELFSIIEGFEKNSVFNKVKDYRNNLIHNYPKMLVSPGITITNSPDGQMNYQKNVGEYTTTSEYFVNIEDSVDFLASIVDQIRMKIT
ncbi:Cthe_2314 family HEPN domain-containing protein [Bacillus altitudinis]|uniref:Cthe_2314 family HEPN domain-containing protein n=1 Tax=Bacillus altitudinis TaxID=293387 RepID=UPI0011A3E47A|nr:Cthe_2314 family HEPN domain-containing protein [Bacillus altitudinis]MDR7669009.1 Cthe_2314 family HEPN domain-containing protein [Bacillus altitudinis]WGV00064.1 Cthe_2314 family HEPN domain-containing protein [Bacillus altitudinis]